MSEDCNLCASVMKNTPVDPRFSLQAVAALEAPGFYAQQKS